MNTTKFAAKWCAATLIIAAVAIGCTNEETDNNAIVPEAKGTVTIVAAVDQPADTRLEYEDEGSGPIKTYWTSTDIIGIYDNDINGYGQRFNNTLTDDETSDKTDFTGSKPSGSGAGHVAVYPAFPAGATFPSQATKYTLTSEGQTQSGNGNTEHLSAFDYMYDDNVTLEQAGSKYTGEVNFKRQMAMLKFKFTIPGYSNTTNGAIASINLSTADMLFTTSRKLYDAAVPDAYDVTLALADMESYDGSDPLTAYMMILPANPTSKTLTIEVTTVTGHTFAISKKVNRRFEAGRYYTMTITSGWTLSGDTRVTFANGVTAAPSFSKGDGTSERTAYYITNEQELKKLIDDVAGGEPYTDTYFKLDADIEVTADSWTYIGSGNAITRAGSTHFAGHFNGNGHSITGRLNITGTNKGFFGYVNGGSIKNLTNKATVTGTGGMQTGGIVGKIENGVISNCTNTGTVSASNYTGGIAGIVEKTHIINCINRGDITSTSTDVGGIVSKASGYFASGIPSAITNCKNYGDVTGKGNVGGIAGQVGGAAMVIDCRNEGKISSSETSITINTGGIVGKNAGDEISNSTNTGEIEAPNGRPVGGIAGYTSKSITSCTNSGKITASTWVGGIVGHHDGGSLHLNRNNSMLIAETTATGTIVGYRATGNFYDCNTSVTVGTLGLIGYKLTSASDIMTCTTKGHK